MGRNWKALVVAGLVVAAVALAVVTGRRRRPAGVADLARDTARRVAGAGAAEEAGERLDVARQKVAAVAREAQERLERGDLADRVGDLTQRAVDALSGVAARASGDGAD